MPVTHLSCFQCKEQYEKQKVHQLCKSCAKPLKVNYDLKKIGQNFTPSKLLGRPANLWRYQEVLPVENSANIICLGEGFTPLFHATKLGKKRDMPKLYIKEEGLNPTASFKARGMALAVSMAKELGLTKLAVPTAGNAGGALAAYAAKAGLEAYIFMPKDVPIVNRLEAEYCGAKVILIDGLITDCAKALLERKDQEGWFDVSTLKEPYRIEGKKTMGYELAEQLNWQLPDAIVYPTGGGTGLIGMWKAFDEMEQLGWITSRRPKMISVQASGCAPMVEVFNTGNTGVEIKNAHTLAAGLRVPRAIGDFIMLDILKSSKGTALSVSDQELIAGAKEIGHSEGVFASPEGGATLAALDKLLANGIIQPNETVVLFNTGSGIKYLEAFQ
ncbi:MAG: threonine synthase [Acidobacteria bacterium]|nr:threonine synthase [Acidobacteriota bacterium]